MTKWKKVLLWSIGGILLCGAGLIGLIFVLFSGMCGNEIYGEYPSPNGRLKAVVFQRDCGATTGFSTQISILKSNATLANKRGNIFISAGHPRDTSPIVTWLSDSELEISKNRALKVYKAKEAWGWFWEKVKVRYK